MIRFILNEKPVSTDLPPGMVMLDFIRYHQHLTGTKIGCREGDCGACTVLVGTLKDDTVHYRSMTSCLMPIANAAGKHIVSIEGINFPDKLNPVQQAMAEEGGTQCGFCTPGVVMSLAGFCLGNAAPTPQQAIAAIDGNICRCTGYKPIERAAARVAKQLEARKEQDPLQFVSEQGIFPSYFATIATQLKTLRADPSPLNKEQMVIGGGTDLYVQKHETMRHTTGNYVLNEDRLRTLRMDNNRCYIGAACTVSDLKNAPVFRTAIPEVDRFMRLVSSTPIRNMATVAGNFVNASPIGDLTIFFLALNAQLVLRENDRVREIPLRNFYKGYKQLNKTPAEQIEEIYFEIPSTNQYFNFEKVSKRTHLDIASVNSALLLQIEDGIIQHAALSAGGVGPVPAFLPKTSAFLEGKKPGDPFLGDAIRIMSTEIAPISDARGTKEYKTLLLGQLLRAHFVQLFPELSSKIITL